MSRRNQIKNNPYKSLLVIGSKLSNKTSGRTVSRYLKSIKWTGKKATKQPDLEEIHKELRFDWAQNYKHYDWSSIVGLFNEWKSTNDHWEWGWCNTLLRVYIFYDCMNLAWSEMNFFTWYIFKNTPYKKKVKIKNNFFFWLIALKFYIPVYIID